MDKFFDEKVITITNKEGLELTFFMRPIKLKEFQMIGRIAKLVENSNSSDDFVDPILLGLVKAAISIDSKHVPAEAVKSLVDTYLDYNFPSMKEKDEEPETAIKKETKRLSFYIDFLVNQGYVISDIMELTVIQFNEIIQAVADRLSPQKKIMDPLEAFKKMGIPIRPRNN